jgi:hypothetical protein
VPLRLPPLRFSLLGLMALVAYVGLGCAALRYATPLWASALFTLAVGLVMIGLLGAVFRREQARAGWIGFLVFGGGYLLLTCGPWSQGDYLLTNYGLAWLELKLHGEAQVQPQSAWTVSGNPSLMTGYGGGGSTYIDLGVDSNLVFASRMLGGNRLAFWDVGSGQAAYPASQSTFVRVGHSLLSPLIGLIGVVIASWLYAGTKRGQNKASLNPVPSESPFTSAEARS